MRPDAEQSKQETELPFGTVRDRDNNQETMWSWAKILIILAVFGTVLRIVTLPFSITTIILVLACFTFSVTVLRLGEVWKKGRLDIPFDCLLDLIFGIS